MAISINNVHKTYKGRKTEQVNALRGVSFTLPETGMVFILGKSGCGKSTLLNVLGGLDGFDEGDIVVDGKSMKDFTAKDYDDYRNNYVGFVFQENNLLEQYTVKRNVGLALDLQSQKGVDEKIAEALEKVDLKDFGERRCNRLSGGQKQRVAIARALIKNPEMLLCDEPTGSLDSDTGKEIFELLKKISENTLVVVVSHDRESAEKYGDRVIEIKDGSVLLDNKPEEEQKAEQKQREQKKSGLPLKRAFAIGAGFLIAKPFRLALCILLCLLTFTSIGISDAFSAYDRSKAIYENMQYLNTPYLSFTKKSVREDKNGLDFMDFEINFNQEDYKILSPLIHSTRQDIRYELDKLVKYRRTQHFNEMSGNSGDGYFEINGFVEMDENFADDYGLTMLCGEYPKTYDEVVITKHLYKYFEKYGYSGEKITKYSDMLGKKLSFSEKYEGTDDLPAFENIVEWKVAGILDTKFNEERYGKYVYDGTDYNYPCGVSSLLHSGMNSSIFLCKGYHDNVYLSKIEELGENSLGYHKEEIRGVFAPMPSKKSDLRSDIAVYEKYRGGVKDSNGKKYFYTFGIENDATEIVEYLNGDMHVFGMIFTFVAIGTTVIAVLFLLYFTTGVISEKKREIGILRALGASRGDTIKIFGMENGLFAVILIAFASALSAVGLFVLNSVLISYSNLNAKFIGFGIRQFAVLAAVAIGAIAVGIAIPIIRLLRAKPVDIIAGRK